MVRGGSRFGVDVRLTGGCHTKLACWRREARLTGVIQAQPREAAYYHQFIFRYHVAFSLPSAQGEMVVAEALDFPGAVTQGFDLADARLMIASALEDLAEAMLEEGKPLPVPSEDAHNANADLIELVPLLVYAGTVSR